ncbi:hypothetical protein QBC47DRAFT_438707 [Echria macrotheca]|uniref:Uncharacterized protein n=1 Tax=Echria macrotheca TaxID=438768 RepID=A0AAJ0B2F7_9PEZI|nr:hypothetical protein QBC47DRAFT_438707 [Echria macrotheca]
MAWVKEILRRPGKEPIHFFSDNFNPGYVNARDNIYDADDDMDMEAIIRDDLTDEQKQIFRTLEAQQEKSWWKWWLLCPQAQRLMKHTRGNLDEYTSAIMKANRMFIINRGTSTLVLLPNGQVVFPSTGMPTTEIHTAVLGFVKDVERIIQETDHLLNKYSENGDDG